MRQHEKNDLLRRLVRELVQPDEKKEPLKIYADNKESYFKVQYIPIHLTDGQKDVSQYVGDVAGSDYRSGWRKHAGT